jgi:hypothetical protein
MNATRILDEQATSPKFPKAIELFRQHRIVKENWKAEEADQSSQGI